MSLNCPVCKVLMRELRAAATTGYYLLLDQCPGCGGVWCDKWELYPLSPAAAAEIDVVDTEAVRAAAPQVQRPVRCPRCALAMISLVDPALPVDAHVERCKQCEGMWLNRGDLRRVKQRSLRHPNLQGETDAAPSVRAASGAAEWPTVGNLNDAMTPSHDDTDPSEDLQRDLLRGGAWVVVRLLLRWFIGL